MFIRIKSVPLHFLLGIVLATLVPNAGWGQLVSVDFNVDASDDGLNEGTLDGFVTTVSGTDGPANGGTTLSQAWALADCTNDVPGIGDPGVVSEATVIDWNPGVPGFAKISFNTLVTDPILLFAFTDNVVETFDFDDDHLAR